MRRKTASGGPPRGGGGGAAGPARQTRRPAAAAAPKEGKAAPKRGSGRGGVKREATAQKGAVKKEAAQEECEDCPPGSGKLRGHVGRHVGKKAADVFSFSEEDEERTEEPKEEEEQAEASPQPPKRTTRRHAAAEAQKKKRAKLDGASAGGEDQGSDSEDSDSDIDLSTARPKLGAKVEVKQLGKKEPGAKRRKRATWHSGTVTDVDARAQTMVVKLEVGETRTLEWEDKDVRFEDEENDKERPDLHAVVRPRLLSSSPFSEISTR